MADPQVPLNASMPEPSPVQRFFRGMEGLGAGMAGRTASFIDEDMQAQRLAQQQTQFQQTLSLNQQQFAEQQKMNAVATSRAAAGILKDLQDSGWTPDEETAGRVGSHLLNAIFGGLSAQGDEKARLFLGDQEATTNLGKSLFTGGAKAEDLVKAWPLVDYDQIVNALKVPATRKNPGPEMQRISDQNVTNSLNAIKTDLPAMVQMFRQNNPAYADPASRVPFPVIQQWLSKTLAPNIPKSRWPVLQAAMGKIAEDTKTLEGVGILSGETAAATGKAQALAPITLAEKEAEASSPTIQTAKQEVAAKTGLAVEIEKRKAPITKEQAATYVHIPSLMQSGELVQPSGKMTKEEVDASPDYAYATPDQKAALSLLAPSLKLYDDLTLMGKRLIRATTPQEAFQQGFRLMTDSLTGANPEARAYSRTKDAFTDTFGRTFGGAKGVISDRDTARFGSAFGTFWDTAQTLAIKDALTRDVINAARQAKINEVSGKSPGIQKNLLQEKLNELDAANARGVLASVPEGQQAVREIWTKEKGTQPLQIKMVPKGKIPAGFEPLIIDINTIDIPMGTRVR